MDRTRWQSFRRPALEDNNIHSALIPAAYTGELQPMDISVNKVVNLSYTRNFHSGKTIQ